MPHTPTRHLAIPAKSGVKTAYAASAAPDAVPVSGDDDSVGRAETARSNAVLRAVKLVLVRHPAPDIAGGICYGRLDVALRPDPAAVRAIVADLAAHRLARVWTSPAQRCRAVAEAFAAAAGLPLHIEPRLRELDFGRWEGVAWDSVPRAALDEWAADPLGFAPPGGETGAALLLRVRATHRALLAAGEDCAVVAHGGPLKLLAALLRGEAPDPLAPAPPLGSVRAFTV
jgi:alpha-ribazole phosphatase